MIDLAKQRADELKNSLPEALAKHKVLGIPESITRDTFSDIDLWIGLYAQKGAVGAFEWFEME